MVIILLVNHLSDDLFAYPLTKLTYISGDCSLTINNLDLKSDDGDWQCQVTAASLGQESLISPLAQVVVLVAPTKPVIRDIVRFWALVSLNLRNYFKIPVNKFNF